MQIKSTVPTSTLLKVGICLLAGIVLLKVVSWRRPPTVNVEVTKGNGDKLSYVKSLRERAQARYAAQQAAKEAADDDYEFEFGSNVKIEPVQEVNEGAVWSVRDGELVKGKSIREEIDGLNLPTAIAMRHLLPPSLFPYNVGSDKETSMGQAQTIMPLFEGVSDGAAFRC